jgi:predicted AAA+ superfamily ATPase
VILDEIQRIPELFATLRGVIDRRREQGVRSGQFLLLRSASHALLQQTSEFLAGRIVYAELSPFHLRETGRLAMNTLWVRGGFPESFLAPSDRRSRDWRTSFIRTYLERDIPTLGPRIPSETLYRFWRMLGHNQGQIFSASRLASSLGVSGQTVTRCLDLLVDLMLARRLEPWRATGSKRLVRSPKTYVRDSGVHHALLDIPDLEALFGHPVAGPSWEGFVIESILAVTRFRFRPYFYRTARGSGDRSGSGISRRQVALRHRSQTLNDSSASRKGVLLGV